MDSAGSPLVAPDLSAFRVRVTETPDLEEYRAIFRAIDDEAAAVTGRAELRALGVVLRAPDGRLAGGLMGRTVYQWLVIELLWVSAELRGRGIGRALVRGAELAARQRGCIGAWVTTSDFQARPFYEKLGYRLIGTHRNLPPGHESYILERRLDLAPA